MTKSISSVPAPAAASLATLTGYASALPTPFRDGAVDHDAFAAFCQWQIDEGIAALVVAGTTGEAPTLSAAEQEALIRIALEVARGRVPVIAGAGANATQHAILLGRSAADAGADGLLVVVPYYNRPTQEGLYQHFRAVHDKVELPILLYDVPSRTGCGLAVETIARLAELPRIVGLKDATVDLARPLRLRRLVGSSFRLLSGDDATALGFLAQGGDGCISVLSNVIPKLCMRLYAAFTVGDNAEARAIAIAVNRLTAALFAESNPIPVKCALHLLGRMRSEVRLPLCEPAEATCAEVAAALRHLGLLSPEKGPTVNGRSSVSHLPRRLAAV
jgi:4-hydroxy-tetrahydrodipicolinate synthase